MGSKNVSFGIALLNVFIVVFCVGVGGFFFKIPLNISFLTATILISLILIGVYKYKASELLKFFFDGCRNSVEVCILILFIGAIIGSWIVGGIVPSLIYYGLKFISPEYFLLTGFLFLCCVSFFIGSVYATAGTVGVALMGIGYGMGFPSGLTAGMVVSGSLFGNKISPFADSTNLCIIAAGVPLLDHIKSMCYTVIPICIASAVVYGFLGFHFVHSGIDASNIQLFMGMMEKYFWISPFLLLVPLLTIVLIYLRVPPVIALMLATLLGVFSALLFQNFDLKTVAGSVSDGFKINTGVDKVDSLLNRGGFASMLSVVEIVLFLMGGGEILRQSGTSMAFMEKCRKVIRGATSLVVTTLFAGLIIDGVTGSQYLAILLPGEMFKEEFKKFKVKLNVLSRTLEDSGTIFSYLIPWSNNAVIISGILSVTTFDYYPYAYQLWFTPILAVICAFSGYAIWYDNEEEDLPVVNPENAD